MLQNPIEPSNDLFEHDHMPDYQIDAYTPPYWPFRKSRPMFRNAYSVPVPNPYRPINPLHAMPIFDPDLSPLQQQDHAVPHRLSTENDYKNYLSSPPSNMYSQQSNSEPNMAIQLLTPTDIFHGFGIPPTYQTFVRRGDDSVKSQNVEEPASKMFKNPLTVIIVSLQPQEASEVQESTDAVSAPVQQKEEPVTVTLPSVEDEVSTTVAPTDSDELLQEWKILKMLMKNGVPGSEGEQDELEHKIEEPLISVEYGKMDDNSAAEDESNSWTTTTTTMTTETPEKESNSIPTEEDSNALPTEKESNIVTTEEMPTEDGSSSSTTIDPVVSWNNWKFAEDQQLKTREIIRIAEELEEQRQNLRQTLMTTVDNISAEFPSNLAIAEIPVMDHTPPSSTQSPNFNEYYGIANYIDEEEGGFDER